MAKSIKNARVAPIITAIQELADQKLPVRGALKLRRIARKLDVQLKDVEAVRMQLLEQYGQRDESGQLKTIDTDGIVTYEIQEDKQETLNEEYRALMEATFELDTTLSIDEDLVGVTISPIALASGIIDILDEE